MKFRITARHTVTHVAEVEALDLEHARHIWNERHANQYKLKREPPRYSPVEIVDIQPVSGRFEPGKAG